MGHGMPTASVRRTGAAGARGFTMLETILAAAMGGLVVLACLTMFAAIDRTETATAERARQSESMARMRMVMWRVAGPAARKRNDLTQHEFGLRG